MYQSTLGHSFRGSTEPNYYSPGDNSSQGYEDETGTGSQSHVKLPDIHRHDIFVSGVAPDYRTEKTLYLKQQISDLYERAEYGNCLAHGPESNIVHEYCGDCDSHCEDCLGVAAEIHQSFLKDRNNFSRMFHERIPVCTCGLKPGFSMSKNSGAVANNNSVVAYKFIKKRNAVSKKQPEDSNKIRVCYGRSGRPVNDSHHLPSIRNKNKLYFPAKSRKIEQFTRCNDLYLNK